MFANRVSYQRLLLVCLLNWQLFPFKMLLAAEQSFSEASKIKIINPSINFGKVEQGTILKHKFYFKNEGKGSLKIENIHTSCNCLSIAFNKDKYYAHDQNGSIEVSFNTSKLNGSIHNVIILESNEPNTPNRTLSMFASIYSDYRLSMNSVDFEQTLVNQSKTKELIIYPIQKNFKILNFNYDKKFFKITKTMNDGNYIFKIILKPQKKPQKIDTQLTISTNTSSSPKKLIPLRANISPPMIPTPSILEFGEIEKNKISKRLLKISSKGNFSIKKSSVILHLNGKRFKNIDDLIKWTPINDSPQERSFEITLKNKSLTSGSVFGQIIFQSDRYKIPVEFQAFFL